MKTIKDEEVLSLPKRRLIPAFLVRPPQVRSIAWNLLDVIDFLGLPVLLILLILLNLLIFLLELRQINVLRDECKLFEDVRLANSPEVGAEDCLGAGVGSAMI
jgi:hypothetical protein